MYLYIYSKPRCRYEGKPATSRWRSSETVCSAWRGSALRWQVAVDLDWDRAASRRHDASLWRKSPTLTFVLLHSSPNTATTNSPNTDPTHWYTTSLKSPTDSQCLSTI